MIQKFAQLGLFLAFSGEIASAAPEAVMPEKHMAFFEAYCLDCHDSDTEKGKINLETLPFNLSTIESAERWQKVLNTLNAGEMPPEDKKAPPPDEKTEFLANLSEAIVIARKSLSDSGGVTTMRRLNRREYANTIRDLLGVHVKVESLPSDQREGAFDTSGSSLYISADQIATYRKLGNDALKEVFFKFAGKNIQPQKHRTDFEASINKRTSDEISRQIGIQRRWQRWSTAVDQASAKPEAQAIANKIRQELHGKKPARDFYRRWAEIPGAASPATFGFPDAEDALHHESQWTWILPKVMDYYSLPNRGNGVYIADDSLAMYSLIFNVPGHWPAGESIVRIRAARVPQRLLPSSRKEVDPFYVTKENEEDRYFLDLDSQDGRFTIGTHQVRGLIEKPEMIEIPIQVYPGEHKRLQLRERGGSEDVTQNRSKEYKQRYGVDGTDPSIWVDYVEIEGPIIPEAEKIRHNLVKSWMDRVVKSESTELGNVIREFTAVALRGRSPNPEFVLKLEAIYHDFRKDGSPQLTALHETLSIVLASPGFLYLAEQAGDANVGTLSQVELASRLSYFLWSSPPDQELLTLAQQSTLANPEVLKAQVDRMLGDPRSHDFVEAFTDQWLGLDRLDFFQFDTKKHPKFALGTKKEARREIYETFTHWLKHGGSLNQLLRSDTVVVNALLADLYDLPGVDGDHFRAVKVDPNSPRGGLLGMAAVSAMGSNGNHTSPVERGAWVMRKLMNDPPPPAPPNIPQLARLEGEVLTTRQRISRHQEEAQCAQCHRRIDPIGFGLENFNAAGKWRAMDDHEQAPPENRQIDPSGQIHKGPAFKDYFELIEIISGGYSDAFAEGFTNHLAEYALGRTMGFSDQEWLESLLKHEKSGNYQIASIIKALVVSPAFREKR